MRNRIVLLAFCMLGFSLLHAQGGDAASARSGREVSSEVPRSKDWSKYPIGYFYGGVGVGKVISAEEVSAVLDMSTGFEWRVGMSRFYKHWGWGVLAQQFCAKQTLPFFDGNAMLDLDNAERLLYVAPQFTIRLLCKERMSFYGAIGLGWLRYKETLNTTDFGKINLTSHALGVNLAVGFEYRLNSVIGLSLDAGVVRGEIKKPEIDHAELRDEFERMYFDKIEAIRVYATVGAHIYFWKKRTAPTR